MAYQSLARKYRPHTFKDLVAQDATAKALANAIMLGRAPQAVLFSGIRGVGKTTSARLYAKALNCMQSHDGEPCGSCENCVNISSGRHVDVMEIDGASNTGVDDVRQLQETLQYKPQNAKYKVYIIDEVHMLSISAFNALLKSLEEPPPHVVFIFATTELQKVPQTIISRCQTFYLKKIPLATVLTRLQEILDQEGVPYDIKALEVIAIEGQGSMRDALTMLDQVIALGNGAVREGLIRDFFPTHSPEAYFRLLEALVSKDKVQTAALIDELDQSGARFIKVVEETAKLARHSFLYRDIGEESIKGQILGLSATDIQKFADISARAGDFDLNRIFRTLVKCRTDLDGSAMDRFIVENYFLEWCLDPGMSFRFAEPSSAEKSKTGKTASNAPSRADSPRSSTSSLSSAALPASSATPSSATKTEPLLPLRGSHIAPTAPLPPQAPKAAPKNLTASLANSLLENAAKDIDPFTHAPLNAPVNDKINEQKNDTLQAPSLTAKASHISPTTTAGNMPAELASAKGTAPAMAVPSAAKPSHVALPASWRELVDFWKKEKPLQARKLEEVHPVKYAPDEIILAVDPENLAAGILLQGPAQKQMADDFAALFGFSGKIIVQRLESENDKQMPTTILQSKHLEREQRHATISQQVQSSPLIQSLLSEFDGKIEQINIKE